MRKKIIYLFMLFTTPCLAQEKNCEFNFFNIYEPSFLVDFQVLKYCSASIGVGVVKIQYPRSPYLMERLGKGIIFDSQFTFRNVNKNFVYSPKVTFFFNYSYFYVGANFSYHTDFKNGGAFQFAPEIGLGAYFIYIVYSKNISISKNDLIPINKNNVSLKLVFPIEWLF